MNDNSRTRAPKYFVFGGLYYGLLSVLSHIPGTTMAELSPKLSDKVLHFAAYSVFGALVALGCHHLFLQKRKNLTIAITACAMLLFGSLDEWHQSFVVGRFPSVSDVIADFAGGTFGAVVALMAHSKIRQFQA